jgi:hypothetical protein
MPEGPPLKIVAARDGRKDQTVGVLHDKGVLVRPLYSRESVSRLTSCTPTGLLPQKNKMRTSRECQCEGSIRLS